LATAAAALTGRGGSSAVHSLSTMTIPTMTTTTKNVVVVEGRPASETDETSKEFLLGRPSGAYTTARTCAGGRKIFEWEAHVERTAKSLASMMAASAKDGDASPSALADPAVLRRRLDAAVEDAVRLHRRIGEDGGDGELKLTALVGWDNGIDDEEGWVACHATSLPPIPSKPVRVEIRGSPRENALAKDSSWVTERAPLEDLMRGATCGPVNELLLATAEGDLLEGSQTNFYAIIGGSVWTAGEGILEGTVRKLVLDVCRENGIPVVLEPPNVGTIETWEGALVSSTSRLALPVDELYVPAEGRPSAPGDLRVAFDDDRGEGGLAGRIRDLVALEVEARSTPIAAGDPVLA